MKKQGTPGFVGERLRLACEIRNISFTSLADILEVSKQLISQYMNGEKTPGSDTFTKIAEKLNFPKKFFLEELPESNFNTVFFRSMSYTIKGQRISSRSKYLKFKEIYYFISQYIESQIVNMPIFDIKNIYSLTDDDIEKVAVETRNYWSLKLGPLSHVIRLLENKGAIITGFEMDASGLDAFSEWDSLSQRPFIVLNFDEVKKTARIRFSAVHELGHIILHRNVDPNDLNNKAKFKIIENQSMKFASAFLLPKESFEKEAKWFELDYFVELKKRWCVSIQAIIMRCHHLGLITDRQFENLYINIGKRGWRKEEPLDNYFEPEYPTFIYKSIELLLQELFNRDDIIHEVSLCHKDFEEIACLPKNFMKETEIIDFNLQIKK